MGSGRCRAEEEKQQAEAGAAPKAGARAAIRAAAPAAPAAAKVASAFAAARGAEQLRTHNGEVREELELEDWQVARVIGRAGSNIKNIQSTCSVRVCIVDCKAVVLGRRQDVERARVRIEKAIWGKGVDEPEDEPWMEKYLYKRG